MSVEAVDSVLRVYPDKPVPILCDLIDFPAAEDSVKSDKTFRPCREEGQKGQQNQYNMFLPKHHSEQAWKGALKSILKVCVSSVGKSFGTGSVTIPVAAHSHPLAKVT